MRVHGPMASAFAIVALGVASLTAVAVWSRPAGRGAPDRTQAEPADPAPARQQAAAPQRAPGAPTALAAPVAASSAPAASVVPAPPTAALAADGSWSDLPIAARASQLGTIVGGAVYRGLQAARDRMDPCFEEDARRSPGDTARTRQAFGPAVLTLDMESRAGTIVVVEAELDDVGRSSRELVACCQQALRGYAMPSPEAPPGERYRLKYVLQ